MREIILEIFMRGMKNKCRNRGDRPIFHLRI